MGNSKSRPAGGANTKSRSRHSKFQSGGDSTGAGNDRVRSSKHQQPLLNDSGHYSIHGFAGSSSSPVDRAETPVGGGPGQGLGPGGAGLAWNHTNLSSPGRLDQQKKSSDTSLHFQYGTRIKNNTSLAPAASAGGPNGHIHNHDPGVRVSGSGLRTTMVLPNQGEGSAATFGYSNNNTILNTMSSQEMMSMHQQQQLQPSYQGADPKPATPSPRQSNGRISAFPPGHIQPQQQQQQQQYSMRASTSPLTVPFIEEESGKGAGSGLGGVISSVAAMNLGPGASAQHQQVMRLQQQQSDYVFQGNPPAANNSKRNSAVSPSGAPLPTSAPVKSSSNQYYQYNDTSYAYGPPDPIQYQQQLLQLQLQQQQQQQYQATLPRLTNTYPVERPKPADNLGNAGPLIEISSSSAQRPLAADQVFARLARQFPTNPRETEKRERIYRWLDHVADALTFNPDTDMPGWIIPVYPDELDHPESPFYLDRITYELDLMAPVGKPFRKAIDINCSTGEWALDMALKFPRMIVYALDPLLETTHVPLRIPDNCKFRMRDVREQEGEFDLVHQRLGAFRTQIQEWTPHFAELRRLTRPGGWIQLAESNGLVVRAGVESLKVNRWVERAALSSGLNPMQMVEALMPTILGAGLINVECYDYGIPVGEWAGPRGQVAMRTYLEMVESLKEEIVEINLLEEGIFEETIELMKMECVVEKAELVMKVIYAQKPPITDDLWRTRGMA